MVSCDKEAFHDYYIKNNCEQNIIVDIADTHNIFSIIIEPHTEKLVYHGDTINGVYEDEITYFIKNISIKNGNNKSNIDPLDYSIWHYEKISSLYANSYLTIEPKDFE